ncbi:MAG: molybdate transporter substrate-binding protein, partial [Actinomycetota bacterium]
MITVAAASDLRPAFNEIAIQFTKQTSIKVAFSFGSSGQLREQIINGAPFDVFASANSAYVDDVIKSGTGDITTRSVYAIGRLAVVTSNNLTLPATLFDLQEARFRRIVIANPQHAPYGSAAQQTL